MFSWLRTKEPKQATWSEEAKLFLDFSKCITYSIIDHEENAVIYLNVPSVPIGGKGFGVDFTPITFLSSFYINSHKGITLTY